MTAGAQMIGHWVHGSGPARALVLPGWLGDWRVFEPMLPALDASRFTLAFMDYRGYGLSRSLGGPFDLATIARDAAVLAGHLNWDTFSVVGHSMGGKAALRLAANLPGRVQSILAITPVWAGKVPFDAQTLAFFRGATRDVQLREAIISNTTGRRLPAAWSRHLAQRSLAVSSEEAFGAYLESWALEDFAADVTSLQVPTTVVVGGHDRGVPRELVTQTWLAGLSNSKLVVLPEAGHYPMHECPPLLGAVFESALLASSDI